MRLVSRKLSSSHWRTRSHGGLQRVAAGVDAAHGGQQAMDVALISVALGAVALGDHSARVSRRGCDLSPGEASVAGADTPGWPGASPGCVPFYEYDESRVLPLGRRPRGDRGPAARRFPAARDSAPRRGPPETMRLTAQVEDGDLRPAVHRRPTACPSSTAASSATLRPRAPSRARSSGVTVTDLDGNRSYDLTGSYGLNVFGYDFYKDCIERGIERARELGPVLGSYHPADRPRTSRASGRSPGSTRSPSTCRAPRRSCRPCAWPAITPGARTSCASAARTTAGGTTCSPGSEARGPPARPTPSRTWSEASLRVLRTRRDIACVLVNPLQALHPNAGAPSDATLARAPARRTSTGPPTPDGWSACARCARERGIVLIFDEVFVGFRLARWRRRRSTSACRRTS